jgi:hypothetical protein
MISKNFGASGLWNRDFFALSSVEKITAAQRVQLRYVTCDLPPFLFKRELWLFFKNG